VRGEYTVRRVLRAQADVWSRAGCHKDGTFIRGRQETGGYHYNSISWRRGLQLRTLTVVTIDKMEDQMENKIRRDVLSE
jgi:hypothetical protein